MKILHRYVLKEHVGPLTFALTALTSILLLQYIGKHFGELVGKGLPAFVIAEFFGLSIPLTVALTLPMAVLVATLYAFSRLAAENEITAMKASGVGMISVLKPVLWAALGVTIVMIGFNDQVLPRSNHRLAVLQRDIAQKKPTFGLREQVINEVSPGKLYLRAGHIDEGSNLMKEVTIYDMADPTRRRTIYADSGNMRMTNNLSDLEMTLYNGNTEDVPTNTPSELQRLYFTTDLIRVRGVGNQFQKTTADSYKSDREMTVCEMQAAQDRARREHEVARVEFEKQLAKLKSEKAKLSNEVLKTNPDTPWDIGLGRLYCKAIALALPKKAKAQGVSPPPRRVALPQTATSTPRKLPQGPTWQGYNAAPGQAGGTASSTARGQSASSASVGGQQQTPQVQPPPPTPAQIGMLENLRLRLQDSSQLMNSYGVEIHKKFALAVACFVFVLLGAPIALRFPRGGVGLTIGVSLFVFALYYVCLIAGESIAKRGMMPAVVSMWMANVIFALIALWLLAKMGQEGTTARGGDMKEMLGAIKGSIRSKIGWRDRRRSRERLAA
ncbi:MAG TPA: LptF/LptG family permease [Gemmatimonadaceae bacterium]|nr:LptF/LptG family permease [Gemmatimonadaceae bacterium]